MSDESKSLSGPMSLNLEADEVLCVEGEKDYDLFIIHEGELMVCVSKGTQLTPLAYLKDGEYMGELSFFDHKPRSAHVVALKPTTLVRIPVEEIDRQFPDWLITLASSITNRLRKTDEVISNAGIRRQNVDGVKPLSIEDQRKYYEIIEKAAKERGMPSPKDVH